MKKITLSLLALSLTVAAGLVFGQNKHLVQAQTATSSSFLITGMDFDAWGSKMSSDTYQLTNTTQAGANWLGKLEEWGILPGDIGDYDSSNFFGGRDDWEFLLTTQAMNASGSTIPSIQLALSANEYLISAPQSKSLTWLPKAFAQEATASTVTLSEFSSSQEEPAQELSLATTLSQIPGQVINIPIAGVDVPWVISHYKDGNYVMVMAMANVCAIPEVGCTDTNGAASVTGSPWNATDSTVDCGTSSATGHCNQLASLKTYNYLTQMDNIYNNLPDKIAGVSKTTVIRNTTWSMDGFTYSGADAFQRSAGYNVPQVRRINLPSSFDWQTNQDTGFGNAPSCSKEPVSNSLGNLFCQARFGTACIGSNLWNTSNPAWMVGTYNHPRLRSADTSGSISTWSLSGDSTESIACSNNDAHLTHGLLPVMWLASSIAVTDDGAGTFADPYQLAGTIFGDVEIDTSIAPNQILHVGSVTPGIFGQAQLQALVTTTGLSSNGYTLYANSSGPFLHAFSRQVIPSTSCDDGSCTTTSASAWADPEIIGVGYTAAGPDVAGDFAQGINYRPFADFSAHEPAATVASSTGTADQVARQAVITVQVSVPGNFPAGNYETGLQFVALPNI